ncbi:flavin-containing monooxygenase [Minwuia thermotolerans]|uniref:NAD(P)/FAD-dependent oxidoreductase n=1 Tax=Minwuia thermotolerans TaxID=2056226 RepID=A0A2M9G6V3_9PROT|nr:NAD(P)/FAD-dependent oxidoreductase [Minwuia thermotolerans]PJK31445.1 NAD(P)/FAD-dependent oxidoreductase [Minwuia thermotolerans]
MKIEIHDLPKDKLEVALDEADYRVLPMVLYHMTGDRKWLEEPFRPARDVRLIADETAGLSEEARAELRRAAVEILSRPGLEPAVRDPGDEVMVEMMNTCLGERIPPEYAPMMREQVGLASQHNGWRRPQETTPVDERPVLIVGAGASGIALGSRLKDLGVPFRIVERNDRVGGTWYENIYPGCGVDTPNHAYSFSNARPYRWHRYFSTRDQLHDYLERSVDEFGLNDRISFRTEVVKGEWDEGGRFWRVELRRADGSIEAVETKALVSAIGQLSLPTLPEIKGLDSFRGPLFHTAEWPEGLDLKGKRVAVIGTGASSMQVVPSIVDEVAELHVYQRSAQWARPIPRYHDPIGEGAQWLLENVPFYAAWFRLTMLWRYGDGLLPTLRKDPDWEHPERSLNRANERHRQEMAAHIEKELEDRPDLIEKCMPTYPPYGKRILLDNGWYQAIKKPNVELITDRVERIAENGVVTEDGRLREVDVVIMATGFKVSLMAARLNLTGAGGRKLEEDWADDDPRAYLGITVPHFPNLFVMQGPNTGLGHGGSAIFQAECQANYIAEALKTMMEKDIEALEPTEQAQEDWCARVDAEHEQMIWTHPGMTTYYRNKAGRVYSVTPFRLVDYWHWTRDIDLSKYRIEPAGDAASAA